MHQTRPLPRSVAVSAAVYRGLLRAYPREMRESCGDEMAQVFRTACRQVARSEGAPGLVAFWLRTLLDLVLSAAGERRAASRGAPATAPLYIIALSVAYLAASIHLRGDADGRSALVLLGGAFLCGSLHPKRAWRWALIVALTIPALLLATHGAAPLHGIARDEDGIAPLMLLPVLMASYGGVLANHLVMRRA